MGATKWEMELICERRSQKSRSVSIKNSTNTNRIEPKTRRKPVCDLRRIRSRSHAVINADWFSADVSFAITIYCISRSVEIISNRSTSHAKNSRFNARSFLTHWDPISSNYAGRIYWPNFTQTRTIFDYIRAYILYRYVQVCWCFRRYHIQLFWLSMSALRSITWSTCEWRDDVTIAQAIPHYDSDVIHLSVKRYSSSGLQVNLGSVRQFCGCASIFIEFCVRAERWVIKCV